MSEIRSQEPITGGIEMDEEYILLGLNNGCKLTTWKFDGTEYSNVS